EKLRFSSHVWLRLVFSSLVSYGAGFLYQLAYLQVKRRSQRQAILALRYETELKQLQQQIHPHFLFNAIHNIYTLAMTQALQTAPMLLKLANVLRYSLNQTQRQKVSLDDEIALINDILALYALKYDPFPLETLSLPVGAQSYRLPALILLPVVENMFKHGDVNEDGWYMQLCVLAGRLSFITRNPILQDDDAKPEPSGLGLANVRERLRLVFGDDHHFKHAEPESFFEVELSFPLYA
ncbi:MAG: histidine kinase, partial [Bacteroidota bacterium]